MCFAYNTYPLRAVHVDCFVPQLQQVSTTQEIDINHYIESIHIHDGYVHTFYHWHWCKKYITF